MEAKMNYWKNLNNKNCYKIINNNKETSFLILLIFDYFI